MNRSTVNISFRYYAVKDVAEHEANNEVLDKELTDLVNEMNSVRKNKEENIKIYKEKNKKWDQLQQQKDDATTTFGNVHKKDESLHAELVETNKRRKAQMASIKTVIFHYVYFDKFIDRRGINVVFTAKIYNM